MSSSSIGDGSIGEYNQQQNQPSQVSVTAFLAKLWALVNDPSCDDLIVWDQSGSSFHVYDQSRFARDILPRYFKHNNFASFIRQLNMYGFRKISTIEHGSLKNEHDDIEFAHPSFIRGHDTLLEFIKRRAPDNQQKVNIQTTKTELPSTSSALVSTNYNDTKSTRSIELSHVLDDVRNLQSKQTSLSDKLFHVQDENQLLWREISILKQKHAKQQQIVSKLMEFLLHFLTNPSQTHRPLVEQQSKTQSHQQQNQEEQHHQQTTQSLKRKPAALMLNEEPKKRQTIQQEFLSSPISNIGRQQGIIINELTDNDSGGWLHTTDTSPLVDLVPSPPPPPTTTTAIINQHLDDDYSPKQGNFEWNVPTVEYRHPLKYSQLNKINSNNNSNQTDSCLTDFFLNTDDNNNNGTKISSEQIDQNHLTGINTSTKKLLPMMKEEQIEFPNSINQHLTKSSIYSDDKQQHEKLIQSESIPLSLDDITDDVDHIQTSLDNIRELMFDNIPNNSTIEDLFSDDPTLLSPLLTTNILTDNTQESKSNNQLNFPNSSSQCKQIILHKNLSNDVNHQLLEQLFNETTKVEKQTSTINQLQREQINLDEKLPRLQQQTANKK